MRFVITIVLLCVLYLVLRHFLRSFIRKLSDGAAAQAARASGTAPSSVREEDMVQCAHCGVYLPASEAITQQGRQWCSQEHARLGVR